MLPDKVNNFFARFEDNTVPPTWPANKDCGLSVADVSTILERANPRKAAGLRACADQLAGVFTDLSNQSLSQSAVPTCFKMANIVSVPKKAKGTELNDYSDIMKCFERIISPPPYLTP